MCVEYKIKRYTKAFLTHAYEFQEPLHIWPFSVKHKPGWLSDVEFDVSIGDAKIRISLYYEGNPNWFKMAFGHPKLSGYVELNGIKTWGLDLLVNRVNWSIDIYKADKLIWHMTPKHPAKCGTKVDIYDGNNNLALTVLGDDRCYIGKVIGTLFYPDIESAEFSISVQDDKFLALCVMLIIADLYAVPMLGRADMT